MYNLTPILSTVPKLGVHGYTKAARVVSAYVMTRKRAVAEKLTHAGAMATMGHCVVELRDGDELDTTGTFQQVILSKGERLKRGDRVTVCFRRERLPGFGALVGLVVR
jgi:hypothetical protein